jgi:lysozyme family protein
MDLFDRAMTHVDAAEGGYANVTSDSGGETFRGVARNFHPGWGGWRLIDAAKARGNCTPLLIDREFRNDAEMDGLVTDFYRKVFWTPLAARVYVLEGFILVKTFDTSINTGFGPAVQMLQRALNDVKASVPPLAVDSRLGKMTEAAARAADVPQALARYAAWQAQYYRDIVKRKPSQAKFLKGWLSRAAWLPPAGWA